MLKFAFGIALVAAALPYGVDLLARVEFPPPAPGSGIVVTGASTGIGRHAAEWMAKIGFVVYAGYRKESDADSIRGTGIDTLIPVKLDVTDEASVASAVEFVSSDLQKRGNLALAGLVNNAGVNIGLSSVEFSSIADWKWVYDVNVFGVIRCTQAFLPLLRQGKGRVVQMSSLFGLFSSALVAPYASSKWALEAISHSLRQELYPQGISVSVVNPGFVKSEILVKHDSTLKPIDETLYGMVFSPEQLEEAKALADEPVVTSEAIEHALTARYPKAQYVVANSHGNPAWVIARMIWLLPTFVLDKLVRSDLQIE